MGRLAINRLISTKTFRTTFRRSLDRELLLKVIFVKIIKMNFCENNSSFKRSKILILLICISLEAHV